MIYLFLALLSYACTYYLTGCSSRGNWPMWPRDCATGLMRRHPANTCAQ